MKSYLVSALCILAICCMQQRSGWVPLVNLNKNSVAAGAPVEITYSFSAKSDLSNPSADLTIFVHFIDQKGKTCFQDDHQPPKPFQSWRNGEKHSWTRTVFVPRNIPSGEYSIILGVYSPSQKKRIPLDAEVYSRNSYRLGKLSIRLPDQKAKIEYSTGWYPPETDPNDFTQTLRWTAKEATVKTTNSRTRSIFYLKVEGVPQAYGIDQLLTISVEGHKLDSFSTVGGRPVLKKYFLEPSLLGTDNSVWITLTVTKTFVPASLGTSKDTRELGVLVHNFYLDSAT